MVTVAENSESPMTEPSSTSLVVNASNNSGLTVSLYVALLSCQSFPVLISTPSHRHPLPILSISEHYTRDTLAKGSSCKSKSVDTVITFSQCLTTTLITVVVGVLLGTQSGRELAITNSFEIALLERGISGDVDMDTEQSGKGRAYDVDREFLEERREQCKSPTSLLSSSKCSNSLDVGPVQSSRSFLRLIYWGGIPLVRNPQT
jgi:hypothetical protein